MFYRKLCYLVILIGSAAFTVLHREMIAVILFLMVLFLPVLLFLSLLWTRFKLSATFIKHTAVSTRAEQETYRIKLCNRSLLPMRVMLFLVAENCFYQTKQKQKITVILSSKSELVLKGMLESTHCGNIKLTLSNINCYDILQLFCLRKRTREQTDLLYLPESEPFDSALLPMPEAMDSELFSQEKSGDDPSEVFGLREFRDGDSLRQIHWKLSSKQEQWLVKENSLPIGDSMLLLLELLPEGMRKTDELLCALVSVSTSLLEDQRVHEIAWFQGGLQRAIISTQEDLFEILGEIMAHPIGVDEEIKVPAWSYFIATEPLNSHVVYFTTAESMPAEAELRTVTAFCVGENGVVLRDGNGVDLSENPFLVQAQNLISEVNKP